jgi:hypothetical protein
MALRPRRTTPARATGHVSHDAQVRIDQRVARILARGGSGRRADPTAPPYRTEHGKVETRRER